MKQLFGTDGVRGEANKYPITPEVALGLGQAIARYFQPKKTTQRIVIGKDTRRSSYMIELAIAAGVCSMGRNAILLGPISTPGVAFLTRAMRADAGIMISASHNPFNDNGIKFFDHEGYKLSDEVEEQIESMVVDGVTDEQRPVGEFIGKALRVEDATGRYVEFVKRTFPKNLTLDGLKVVVDCANGAAYKQAPMALWELGADVSCWGIKPNGININEDCGALHPEKMLKMVRHHGADIGIGLDGDADRVVLCDHEGCLINGDQVIALCALEMQARGELDKNTVVGTVMTNLGVETYLKKKGIVVSRTAVGDRYIIERMREQGFSLGGEPSGHVIFSRFTTTGDGIVAALQVLTAMARSGKTLKDLVAEIPVFPQVSAPVSVKERRPLAEVAVLQKVIAQVTQRLGNRGRTVIRYSGTEPVLRLMVEGENQVVIQKALEELVAVAKDSLG